MNSQKSMLNKLIIKRLHRMYDYQISCGSLQCKLCETPKKYLRKRFIIKFRTLKCSISILCSALFIRCYRLLY